MGRRFIGCFSLAMLVGCAFVGCGGKSEEEGDDSSSGGSSGSSGAGGTGGTGGTAGSSGTSGGGDICLLPPDSGPCEAAFRHYAFDPKTGLCLPFLYGGCQGNANNFETPEACYAECGGHGGGDSTACESPEHCALIRTTCCGDCDEATAWNVVAIGKGLAGAVWSAMGCELADCVPCDAPPPNPWLFATCSARRCVAKDALEIEITECTQPGDCHLRAGLGCCEECSSAEGGIVAVNSSPSLDAWVCGGAPVGCDPCVPTLPRLLSAGCDGGRCRVDRASPPPD